MELFDQYIGTVPVSVRNDDLSRARLKGPAYGGVYILGHQLAKARVLRVPRRDLVPGGHSGNTFHVCGDKDFHAGLSSGLLAPTKQPFIDQLPQNWITIVVTFEQAVPRPRAQDVQQRCE